MGDRVHLLTDFGIILILIVGISQFRSPRGARFGNATAALALALALVAVGYRNPIMDLAVVIGVAMLSAVIGSWVALRVSMIQIPAMVAFQHGAGGVAASLVASVELTRAGHATLTALGEASGILGLVVGAATFSGSMIAAGKLADRIKQTPTVLRYHNGLLVVIAAVIVAVGLLAGLSAGRLAVVGSLIVLAAVSVLMGVVFSIRVGGADMPVLISFLNATAGLAAALCGLVIQNRLLIACGATVAASGSILTHVMCAGMNRGLLNVFMGMQPARRSRVTPAAATAAAAAGTLTATRDAEPITALAQPAGAVEQDAEARGLAAIRAAQRIIIVPGYGMALADAQFEVAELAERLVARRKSVKFAVHPLAGRMPGHMHVLLAEAEVEYDMLFDLKVVSEEFAETDLAVVVGACDVVNPAALLAEESLISGMPILRVHEAKQVIVCNLDESPGYSGVPNPLYEDPKAILLFGDAKATLRQLLDRLMS